MFTFSELQGEVKRGAIRDKASTEFDTTVKNAINRAINRIAKESRWRPLRKESSITTVASYSEGTGAVSVTEDSTSVTITGATLITDNIEVGRRINIGGSSLPYRISTITGETTLTLDRAYDGSTSTTQSYSILPQGTYNLPMQASHEIILWHEQYGAPRQLDYTTSQESFGYGLYEDTESIPTRYRMWGEDSVISQPLESSTLSIVSSSASDTTQTITIFGTVSNYPDYETLSLNGTNSVTSTKSFSSVERVVSNSTARVGRVTVTANSGNTTIAVLPVGATTREVKYCKIQIRPLPNGTYPIYCYYYKTPYMLVNNEDVHELGSDFDNAIIYLAISMVRGDTSQKEATTYLAMYKDELKVLRKYYLDKIDWLPRLTRSSLASGFQGKLHSNLNYSQIGTGGWFAPSSGR